MPKIIGKVGERYFVFSTVVDAPITGLMMRDEFEEYYQNQYGLSGMNGFDNMMDHVDRNGVSSLSESFDEMICVNRYGDDDSCLSPKDFIAKLVKETEELKFC